MNFCPYCQDVLPAIGTTITLCSCAQVRNEEAETRQRRKTWSRERSVAMIKQQAQRRAARRTKTEN